MTDILHSRKFWLLLIDFVGIVGGYILQTYLPQYQQAVVLIVGAAQPLILYFLSKFTQDDTLAKVAKSLGKTLLVLFLLVVVSSVVFPLTAFADGPVPPTDEQLFVANCTDQGLVGGLMLLQKFTSDYGWDKQLTTPQSWVNAYPHVTNAAAQMWCHHNVIINPGDANQITTAEVRFYAPYLRWLYNQYVALGLVK